MPAIQLDLIPRMPEENQEKFILHGREAICVRNDNDWQQCILKQGWPQQVCYTGAYYYRHDLLRLGYLILDTVPLGKFRVFPVGNTKRHVAAKVPTVFFPTEVSLDADTITF